MTLHTTVLLTTRLLEFNLILQAVELLSLIRKPSALMQIWSTQNLMRDLEMALPLPRVLTRSLFSDLGFFLTLGLQLVIATGGLLLPDWVALAHPLVVPSLLLLTHLLICIRFRGTWNGGSDQMTFVILTGVCISQSSPSLWAQKLGMVYIAIHALYSYFKAGRSKLMHPEWQSGRAIPGFLKQSVMRDMTSVAKKLEAHPGLARALSWSVLWFEMGILLLPFFPALLWPYFLSACVFHLAIALCLGLNRFFWIWLTAWPALAYFSTGI